MDIVTADYVKDKLDAGGKVQIVNVLSPESFNERRIPGSINIPVDQLEQKAPEVIPDQSMEIIVYCANTDCQASPKAAATLEEMGYRNVKDFEAGLEGWEQASYGFSGDTV